MQPESVKTSPLDLAESGIFDNSDSSLDDCNLMFRADTIDFITSSPTLFQKRQEPYQVDKNEAQGLHVKRYGKEAESVMHAVATKQAKEEDHVEQDIIENIIETMQRVLDTDKEHSFTFKNGDMLDIDADTAERLMSVYEELNDENRDQFVNSLERNQKHFMKLLDFSATVGAH